MIERTCEDCEEPATHLTADDVDLCQGCYDYYCRMQSDMEATEEVDGGSDNLEEKEDQNDQHSQADARGSIADPVPIPWANEPDSTYTKHEHEDN